MLPSGLSQDEARNKILHSGLQITDGMTDELGSFIAVFAPMIVKVL